MTQSISPFLNGFVTDKDRAKALVKYELNTLKSLLRMLLDDSNSLSTDKVIVVCDSLANKYVAYFELIGGYTKSVSCQQRSLIDNWPEHFRHIFNLEQKFTTQLALEEEKKLLLEIISLYQSVKPPDLVVSKKDIHEDSKYLKHLFGEPLNVWLLGLVDFWNQHGEGDVELVALFRDWSIQQQQQVLSYFSDPEFVNLVNAVFFYKLYPDRLFSDWLHPEKIISVRMRLGVLHYYIELMQQHLYGVALQNGLIPGVDYFLHDDELPQGILIETNQELRQMIQLAIKGLKINYCPANTPSQANLDSLHDLGRAYKFWFNPNRLIDAVMALHQNILSGASEKEGTSLLFREKMVDMYRQLSTTECLDLYGYFANKDTRYLLNTFFTLAQGGSFDWLPQLSAEDQITMIEVFEALHSVMEALRMELKHRHMLTEPYAYDRTKPSIQIGHRNRDAVFRTIAIYKRQNLSLSDSMEELFQYMGEED